MPLLWWRPLQLTALNLSLSSSYCLVVSPYQVDKTLFLHFQSKGKSHVPHPNSFLVSTMGSPFCDSNLCHRPVINDFRVVSQKDSKGDALWGSRPGPSPPQSTQETLKTDFQKDWRRSCSRIHIPVWHSRTQCWLWPCTGPWSSTLEARSLMGGRAFLLVINQGCRLFMET